MESSVLLSEPVAAHAALMRLWPTIKGELVAGNRHELEVMPYEEHLRRVEQDKKWDAEPDDDQRIRKCTKCGRIKQITEFHKDSAKLDGYRPDCKACNTSRVIAYYPKNRQKIIARVKQWKIANPEREEKYRSGEKFKLRKRAADAAWRKNNKELMRLHSSARRARERRATGKPSRNIVSKLLLLQRGMCAVCMKPLNGVFHLDHIVPLVSGGSNHDSNLQLLHSICNLQKNKRDPVDFMQSRGFLL